MHTRFYNCILPALCILVTAASLFSLEPAVHHPLDALTPQEYWTIYKTLRKAGHLHEKTLFPMILLHEPLKQDVLSWKPGEAIIRRADVVLYEEGRSYESLVNISESRVESFHELKGFQAPFTHTEEHEFEDLIKKDPRLRDALRKRDISDLNLVFCFVEPAGFVGLPEQQEGRRIGWGGCSYGEDAEQGHDDREIGGIFIVADMGAKKILRVTDEGVVPMPAATSKYDSDGGDPLPNTKPISITQPAGPGFTIRDGEVRWQQWAFRFRLDPRIGPVVNAVSIEDSGKRRSVMYEGSLSEMFVPYMDPHETWTSHAFLDAGEYFMNTGLGIIKSLSKGLDCPDYATYFSGTFYRENGTPFQRPQLACLFERTVGDPSWRHWSEDTIAGRPGRELVLRTVAVVGNYDYVLDWRFEQEGSIKVAVGATGILEVKPVKELTAGQGLSEDMGGKDAEGKPVEFGHLVAPGIDAVDHDHFFSFRLDLDVDGVNNTFMVDKLVQIRLPEGGPRKTIWAMQPNMVDKEASAMQDVSITHPAMWRFANTNVMSPLGYPTSYEIMAGETGVSLLSSEDWVQRRGGYSAHQLWVTPYDPTERYVSGNYVTNSKDTDTLPTWVKKNRNIMNTDIVAWYTMGFHHVPRPEDWPVMPTMWHDFTIRPFDFFPKNPGMDLPMTP